MLPANESSIRSVLASRGASKIRVEGTTLREVITALYGEIKAEQRKTKLTWNGAPNPDECPDPKLQVGELMKWKPYTGPLGIGRYFVQNMKVLYSNGQPVKDLSTISTEKRVERLVDGKGNFLREATFASDKELVDNALKYYMQDAMLRDPNLCPHCFAFTTTDKTDFLRHLKKVHKAEFEKLLALDEDEEEVPPTLEEPPVKKRAAKAQ